MNDSHLLVCPQIFCSKKPSHPAGRWLSSRWTEASVFGRSCWRGPDLFEWPNLCPSFSAFMQLSRWSPSSQGFKSRWITAKYVFYHMYISFAHKYTISLEYNWPFLKLKLARWNLNVSIWNWCEFFWTINDAFWNCVFFWNMKDRFF